MTREEKLHLLQALQEQSDRRARTHLLHFTTATMPTFEPATFHRHYYELLHRFALGEIKKLMVFMPPQHGKSEGSTRRLPAYLLGCNPHLRIAIVCYSASKAKKFNREIQRIIDSPDYLRLFPHTTLAGSKLIATQPDAALYQRTSEEFEIVGQRGLLKSVGVGGPLTGDPVDILIMDDLYKDAKQAWSPTWRGTVQDWYDTVADTRLHNHSQQLIVFTRWHEDDLAGHLLRQQGVYHPTDNAHGWQVIAYPALKVGAPTPQDPREEGEALWPERHSQQKLEAARRRNPHVFESLQQQNPQPREGLMYEQGFRTYSVLPPSERVQRKAYVDTADTGADYLCAIIYDETPEANYIVDVLYTQRPMEHTEPLLAQLLSQHRVQLCIVESNNGGRSFQRAVEQQCRRLGNHLTRFRWMHQGENKQVRINVHSAAVQNLCFMPQGWEHLFPDFHRDLTHYLRVGRNAHDDAPDALTGTVEQRTPPRSLDLSRIASRIGR